MEAECNAKPNHFQKVFTDYLDDFYELVHPWVPRENWLSEHEFREHAARTPDIDIGRVVCKTKQIPS